MGWRGLVWIDKYGRVWEITPDRPEPHLIGQPDTEELDLTDADRQLLADLKVTV